MLLEQDDILDTTRSNELCIIQASDFPFWVNCGVSVIFHSYEYPRFWAKYNEATESLAFHRVIALLRTDGDHGRKLVLTRLFALSPAAVSRIRCFEPSQSIHCIWAQILLAQHCALKLPNTQLTYDLLCLRRHHRRIKRSLIFGLSLHIFSPNSTLLCWYNLLVVRFPQVVVPPKLGAQGFRSMRFILFGWCLKIAFFCRRIQFCVKCILRIPGVSRRSVQTQFFNCP